MTAREIGLVIFKERWKGMKKADVLEAIEGTMQLVKASNPFPLTPRVIKVQDAVFEAIHGYYGFTHDDLKARKKRRNLTDARMIASYVLKEITHYNEDEIARLLGIRDRSTIYFYYKRMQALSYDVSVTHAAEIILINTRKIIESWESEEK